MVSVELFAVIVTFGLIFVICSSLSYGLANSVRVYRAPVTPYRWHAIGIALVDFIVIPAIIIGLLVIIPFESQVKLAFLVLALCAGAPFVPMLVKVGKGDAPYAAGMVGFLSIISWIILPLVLPFAVSVVGTGVTVSAWLLLWPLLLFMAIPMAVGLIVRAWLPELAKLGLEHLPRVALVALLFHITLYFVASLSEFTLFSIAGVLSFAVAFTVIGVVIGYLLGPRGSANRGARVVPTVACAQRNTGVGIVTLIFAFGAYAITGVALLLASLLTIIVLLFVTADWSKRYTTKQETAPSGE